jgi:hypothetical protein
MHGATTRRPAAQHVPHTDILPFKLMVGAPVAMPMQLNPGTLSNRTGNAGKSVTLKKDSCLHDIVAQAGEMPFINRRTQIHHLTQGSQLLTQQPLLGLLGLAVTQMMVGVT